MQKTPENTLMLLPKLKEEFSKKSLPELAEHPFIANQLGIYFGEGEKSKKIINQFKVNYMILVSDPDQQKNLSGCDHFSMVQSLINLAKDNLSINPADKESCIVKYGTKAVGIPMWRGKLKRMQERGIIRYFDYLEVVYDCDIIDDMGNGKFTHKPKSDRPTNAKMLEVVMIAVMPDGRPRFKRIKRESIIKRQAKSKMPGIWKEWPEEMWRKTAIGIFEGEIGVKALHFQDPEEDGIEEEGSEAKTSNDWTNDPVSDVGFQDANVVDDPTPEAQDILLRTTLDGMKGLLEEKDRSRLEQKIDEMTDEDLQKSIDGIRAMLAKKESPKPEPEAVQEQEVPPNNSPL